MKTRKLPILLILQFMLALPQAAVGQSTGLLFADDDAYRSIPLAAAPLQGNLPSSVDMSERFPPPGNQGNQGSCVGWAIAYALKSYQENDERSWGLSTQNTQFSPAYIYNQVKRGNGCQGGSVFIDALNLLRREGVATLSDFPYNELQCSSLPGNAIRSRAREYAIADWRRVNVQDTIEVKSQIAAGFPVLIGMEVDSNFNGLGSEVYSQFSGPSSGGHAVVVLGYDDNRRAFKIINSWGRDWGDSGYGWIGYSAFRSAVREGYVVHDIILNPIAPTITPKDEDPVEEENTNVLKMVDCYAGFSYVNKRDVRVCVSSMFENDSYKFGARALFADGDEGRPWLALSGKPQVAQFDFDQPVAVSGFLFQNGDGYNKEYFYHYSRVSKLRVLFSTGRKLELNFEDHPRQMEVNFRSEKNVSWVRVEVQKKFRTGGEKYTSTALSYLIPKFSNQ